MTQDGDTVIKLPYCHDDAVMTQDGDTVIKLPHPGDVRHRRRFRRNRFTSLVFVLERTDSRAAPADSTHKDDCERHGQNREYSLDFGRKARDREYVVCEIPDEKALSFIQDMEN